MSKSKISWATDTVNFYTWNCTPVSEGCLHCYAREKAKQYPFNSNELLFESSPKWRNEAVDEFIKLKTGRVFINAFSDTYHEHAPLLNIQRIHTLINQKPTLQSLVLTKRPERALQLAGDLVWPANLWLGVSVESPKYLNRFQIALSLPAQKRFISFEPLLTPISLEELKDAEVHKANWIVVGGESGYGYRPFVKEWLDPFIDLSRQHGIPLFFKQGGGPFPDSNREYMGKTWDSYPPEMLIANQPTQLGLF